MKKRIISAMLASLIVVSALTGCSGNSEEQTGESTDEVEHIVMTYCTMGTTPSAMSEIEDAVNEITVPEIGVEVEFKDIGIYDTYTQYSMWITSGDVVDLMMIPFTNLSNYSSQGLIQPISDLLKENAPYITEAIEEENLPLTDGSYYEGEAYGVTPIARSYGAGGSTIFVKRYLDDAGIKYDEEKVYTLDEMTEIFAAIKEAHPEIYPCGQITASGTSSSYFDLVYDTLGATSSSGVLMGTDSTEVVKLYGTDEYYDFLSHMKEWFDAGYIYPDSATTDSTAMDLVRAGTLAGYPMSNMPGMKQDAESALGEECVLLKTTEPYYTAQSSSSSMYWTIPLTAEHPEAAVRFLDYTYSNHDLANLIMWGIEGEHYVVTDEENNVIAFPEGVDGNTSTYYNTLGLYGDRRYEYVWDASYSQSQVQSFTDEAMGNATQAVGYAFDTTDYATQISNIDAVIKQYQPTLESGSESNLDAMYQEFITALEDAGINEVIAANQEQFDEWQAQN